MLPIFFGSPLEKEHSNDLQIIYVKLVTAYFNQLKSVINLNSFNSLAAGFVNYKDLKICNERFTTL
jgi:hypothetical protein